MVDFFQKYVTLYSVMGLMKSAHIDWLDAQVTTTAPVEGHDGFRVDSREAFLGVTQDPRIPQDAAGEMTEWADQLAWDAQDAQDACMA